MVRETKRYVLCVAPSEDVYADGMSSTSVKRLACSLSLSNCKNKLPMQERNKEGKFLEYLYGQLDNTSSAQIVCA